MTCQDCNGYGARLTSADAYTCDACNGTGETMDRALDNIDTATAAATTSDFKVTGNPDIWTLICKASSVSQGWMKSTKAMEVPGGCVVQVTTEHRADNRVVACAEALTFVPGLTVAALLGGA